MATSAGRTHKTVRLQWDLTEGHGFRSIGGTVLGRAGGWSLVVGGWPLSGGVAEVARRCGVKGLWRSMFTYRENLPGMYFRAVQ